MRRKPRPLKPDLRQSWQIEQAARCPCRGADDMCPCQNENTWPQPRRDYEAEVRTLELQQHTDRETIASLRSALTASEEQIRLLREALEPFAHMANDMTEFCEEHVLRVVYDDPEWGDNTVLSEVFVRAFRRASLRLQPEGGQK